MKLYKTSLIFAITLIFTISIPNFHPTEAAGFSIDLIQRDSLQSPSPLSPFEHVEAATIIQLRQNPNPYITLHNHPPPTLSPTQANTS